MCDLLMFGTASYVAFDVCVIKKKMCPRGINEVLLQQLLPLEQVLTAAKPVAADLWVVFLLGCLLGSDVDRYLAVWSLKL